MAQVFISYSSKHRELTRELVAAIEGQFGTGSVWWDHALESRASFSEQIKAALEQARVVVVIWTAGAMVSDYVYAEANMAQAQGKLVNVRPADLSFREIPEPFNIYHIDEAEGHERILATIAKVMAGTPIPTRVPLYEIYFRQYDRRIIDPKRRPLPCDLREISPTELLQAKYEVVDYLDTTGMKADFAAWCADQSRPTAARLLHGPGGVGKTRLVIELARILRRDGWMAGLLELPHDQAEPILRQRWQALDQLIARGDDKGLFIAIDYAEGRQQEVRALAERLYRRPEADARPVRVVLLARTAGEWWATLHAETPEVQRLFRQVGDYVPVIGLPDISAGRQRIELFRQSLAAFQAPLEAQGYRAPAGNPTIETFSAIENRPAYARPLAVQMQALLWLASAAPEAGGVSVDELLNRILGLERDHWKKLLGALNENQVRDMARAVAQVTAVQGTPSRPATERLLMADGFYQGQRTARVQADPVIRCVSRVYGGVNGGVAHLEPDLIGEHHVALVGDVDLIEGCLRWIESEPPEAQEKLRRNLLTVLQRSAAEEHGAQATANVRELLDHLISEHIKSLAGDMIAVAIEIPGKLIELLDQQVSKLDEDALAAIDATLPRQSLTLMQLSLRVAELRAHMARNLSAAADAAADFPPEVREDLLSHLAARNHVLGSRFADLGRQGEALAATQKAVDLRRRLAQTRSDDILPDLARSLNNLGNNLSRLGRHEEALAATQDAVDLRRRLAQTRSDDILPDLAGSLRNLGNRFSDLGRPKKALEVSQEAVDIYRCLAQKQPDVFLPDLAMSLQNLGATLSDLGRHEEALAVSQEAVDIRKRLAQTQPDAFLPDLARSLGGLGTMFSQLGRHEEALAASQEAVDIRRRLAQTQPDAFLPDLAMSLENLGPTLADLGRHEEALAASQEAVDIRKRLAQTQPDAFLPDLAMSLERLGATLSHLDRHEEALRVCQEAVDIYRHLARLPDLAGSLSILGAMLSILGRHEEALTASEEAVEIRRLLAQTRPDAFLPHLAISLGVLGVALAAGGRHRNAAAATREGLMTIASFAGSHLQAFGDLTLTLRRDYLSACEKSGTEPDQALLAQVERTLGI